MPGVSFSASEPQTVSNFRRLLPKAPIPTSGGEDIDPQRIVADEMDLLERWAAANLTASNRDFARYWAIKIPTLLCTLAIVAIKPLGFGNGAAAALGAFSTLLISLDSLWPGGLAYNAHRRAANEIRRLQADTSSTWNEAKLTYGTDPQKLSDAAVRILKNIRAERGRIDQQVTAIETSLDRKSSK